MSYVGADRIQGIDKPTVWNFLTPLAIETGSTNMSHGFPNWSPNQYVMERLAHHMKSGNHQYCRAFGIPRACESIAKYYGPFFNRKIDHMAEVTIGSGSTGVLFNAFNALLNPGDEVILLDPSYDCYRGQIKIAGGKAISIPLKETKSSYKTKEQILKELDSGYDNTNEMLWEVDWDALNLAINEKTRVILVCTIHNPTGKVFQKWELEKIAKLVDRHPRIVCFDDRAYEAQVYGNTYKTMDCPRLATLPGMWDRTITFYSGGKKFSFTGIRFGWAIGPNHYLKYLMGINQYAVFGNWQPMQEAFADAFDKFSTNSYWVDVRKDAQMKRDHLLRQLALSNFDLTISAPQGGFFLVVDISKVTVPEKYYTNSKTGEKLTKDFAFCNWWALDAGVVAVPCSYFYGPETAHQGHNMIRIAICKTMETITETGRRLRGLPRQKL